MGIEQQHSELVAALNEGLVIVEKHRTMDEWVYTVAGTFAQGAAPTEHGARLEGVRTALRLIDRLLNEQSTYLDELARFYQERDGHGDDGLEPFKRAFREKPE